MAGDLAKAQVHYRQALQQWEKQGSSGPWANTLNSIGVIHYLRGEYTEARRALREALAKSQQAGDLRVEAFVWASLGDLRRDTGNLEKAQEAYTQALEVAHRTGVGFIVTYVLDALGNTFRLQGEEAHAWNQLRRAMEQAEQNGSGYEIGLCHTSLGILSCEVDDPESARYHLEQAAGLLKGHGSPADLARALLFRGQVAFLAGERELALEDVKRTVDLTKQLDYDQFLVVNGLRVQPLLKYASGQGCETETLRSLLERIRGHETLVARQTKATRPVVPAPSLRITALGVPRVEVGGQAVHWTFAKSRDLFFYLLEHPEGLRKEEIGAEFWPTHDSGRLDSIFRSTIYRLRRMLFRECVVYEEGRYRFNWESEYWYDVEMMERLVAETVRRDVPQADITLLEQVIELYQGDYLRGVDGIWAEPTRLRLRETYAFTLHQLGEKYAELEKPEKAIEVYKSLLVHEPCQEAAHRELMRCYQSIGNRDYAIRQYHTCAETLREELGVSPEAETDALYLEILG
jgi:DNA-binding SARP family transcriptional activator